MGASMPAMPRDRDEIMAWFDAEEVGLDTSERPGREEL